MKKIVFNILGSLTFITTAFFFACKKDHGDTTPPEIQVTNPYYGQTFMVGDTIHADFSVSDNTAINSISVMIADSNLVTVMSPVGVFPTSKNASYHLDYPISDLHLNGGLHYFKVVAFDGYNNVTKYQRIYLTALPKKRLAYFFVTHPTANSVQVSRLDSALNPSAYYSLNGDLVNSDISSYTQQLFTCGMYTGHMNAIALDAPAVAWYLPVINNSIPYFENVYSAGNTVYVSCYQGSTIKGYDGNGNQRFIATVANNYYPIHTFRHDIYLVTEAKDVSSLAKKIILYYAAGGASFQECIMNQDVVSFFTKDSDNIFVFGNNGNQGVVQIYRVSTNGFWSPLNLAAGKILSVAQVSSDVYLIAHSNGTIYKYQYSNSSIVPFIPGVTASHMAFDDVN
ncbi:MAG TPA: DUF4625 domain-containing protein, partial [Bacteroidia bacterium]